MFTVHGILPTTILFVVMLPGYRANIEHVLENCNTSPEECRSNICSGSTVGEVCVDNSCDNAVKSCSEGARSDGDNLFPCRILTGPNCNSVGVLESADAKLMKPPLLEVISAYLRTHRNIEGCNLDTSRSYPALNLSFTLPYAHHLATKTTAIKLHFRSSCEKDFGVPDCYYYKNPVFRLFDFRNATLGANDIKNPRIISYSCLMGLQRQDGTYYEITLTSFPYLVNITYRVTIFEPEREWRTAVAVAVLPGTQDLHVVFQRSTEKGFKGYHIYLISSMSKVIDDAEVGIQFNNHTFKSVSPGYYEVKISVVGSNCDKKDCNIAKSSFFKVTSIQSPEEDDDVDVALATALGILGGLALIAVVGFIYFYKQKPQPKEMPKLRVLILRQYVCDAQSRVEASLVKLMTDVFKCEVTDPESHLSDIHKSGHFNKWLNEQLNTGKHNKIVLLYPMKKHCQKCSARDIESNNNTIVKDSLAEAEEIILRGDSKILRKVIQVYFSYSSFNDMSSALHTGTKIHLMKDFKKFYKLLYSISSVNMLKNDKKGFISSAKYYLTNVGETLKNDIEEAKTQMSCRCVDENDHLAALNNNNRPIIIEEDHRNIEETYEMEILPSNKSSGSVNYTHIKDSERGTLPTNQIFTSAKVHASEQDGNTIRRTLQLPHDMATEPLLLTSAEVHHEETVCSCPVSQIISGDVKSDSNRYMLDRDSSDVYQQEHTELPGGINKNKHANSIPPKYPCITQETYPTRSSNQPEFICNQNCDSSTHCCDQCHPEIHFDERQDSQCHVYSPSNSRRNFVSHRPHHNIHGPTPVKNNESCNCYFSPSHSDVQGRYMGQRKTYPDCHHSSEQHNTCNSSIFSSPKVPNGSLVPNSHALESRHILQAQEDSFDCKHGHETEKPHHPTCLALISRCASQPKQQRIHDCWEPKRPSFANGSVLNGRYSSVERQNSHPHEHHFVQGGYVVEGQPTQFTVPMTSSVLSDATSDCAIEDEFIPPEQMRNSITDINKLMDEAIATNEIYQKSPSWP